MVKKVMAVAVMLVMAFVSSACGSEWWWLGRSHYSLASIRDGKADYSDARFSYVDFGVRNDELIVTEDNKNLTGSITLVGGRYSFWDGQEMQNISGTSQTFRLRLSEWVNLGDEAEFSTFLDTGRELQCGIEADNGLNGVTADWSFPDMPSLNGRETFPNFMTTKEQLDNCVLYFEFIRSGENVTGINWRVVKASDTSTPATQDFRVRFHRFRAWNFDEKRIIDLKPDIYIDAGETPEGVLMLDSPVKASDIWHVMTRFATFDDDVEQCYYWNYYVPTEPTSLYLFSRHASDASLVNGKSDYSSTKFSNVTFFLPNTDSVIAESKHFTDAGRLTIPGGGYTLVDADTGATLSTVTGNATIKLRFDSEGAIGSDYLEYWTVNDSGRLVAFGGGADTGLNGKTVSWTFPAELGLDGNGVVSSFKSTSQQLASGVPYIEVISKDGYITAVNYKIVTASDTSTAITPNHRTDFRFYFDRTDGIDVYATSYWSDRQNNSASGTCTLGTPQLSSLVKRIRYPPVQLRRQRRQSRSVSVELLPRRSSFIPRNHNSGSFFRHSELLILGCS